MRCCASLWLKGLQNCKRSNLEVRKKMKKLAKNTIILGNRGSTPNFDSKFFWISNVDLQQFCSPLSLTNTQYLIRKS